MESKPLRDILDTTVITRAPGLLLTEVDGETVLMHVDQGQYYGLARTAHRVWELLESPCSFGSLCQALRRLYSGADEQIVADTRRFVQQMADEALVTLA